MMAQFQAKGVDRCKAERWNKRGKIYGRTAAKQYLMLADVYGNGADSPGHHLLYATSCSGFRLLARDEIAAECGLRRKE